jgi:serine/threonine protein kinase/WD40 repeat protein
MAEWNLKANDIFVRAAEIDLPDERRRFLEQECAGNADLRAQVESLLVAGGRIGSFLEKPAAPALAALGVTAASPSLTEGPGTVIGPYKLLQHLGEGGMGAVYMAEQTEPVRRMVALKIIKPGMDSAQVIARFEAERQALALMDHPHIARVLDAGTTASGRPYFVMELVKGIPITRFCDEHQLTPRQRLELFVPVCQAVQHAHQKGIIHRDLKPSNVLVAEYDDRPVPKVIDFGVAKATGEKLTERTLFTALGAFVGTLEYMSPEQAKLNALDIDTRSDVYALGVLLYELLTGSTPLERARLQQAALDEVLRVIREEEPPRPSTRLSQSGAALAAISARRKTEPARLGKVLRGELDWIVMKALEKDRSRRYESANGLARDLEHYLKDEAVEACPPSAGYRLRKFARKHKTGLVTAAAMAALLVAGIAISTWQAVRATRAEGDAVAKRDEAEKARQAEVDQRQIADGERTRAQRERDEAKAARREARRALYTVAMNSIQTAWETHDVGRVLELLEETRPGKDEEDLRGFEWHYWNRLCHSELQTWHRGGNGEPGREAGTFSPDGTRYAALVRADDDKPAVVKVWDTATGKEVGSFRLAETRPVMGAPVFSRDGKRLALIATISEDSARRLQWADYRVVVWEIATGKELFALKGDYPGIALSPDGGRVAATVGRISGPGRLESRHVVMWDVATGKELAAWKEGGDRLTFSPDGSRLAGVQVGNTIVIWDAATGNRQLTIPPPDGYRRSGVRGLAFSPDGKRLVAGGSDMSLDGADSTGREKSSGWIFDTATGQELVGIRSQPRDGQLRSWGRPGLAAVFSHDGKILAARSGRHPSLVEVINAENGATLVTLKGHPGEVVHLAFSPDDTRLCSSDDRGKVKVWDISADALAARRLTFPFVVVSPDGSRGARCVLSSGRRLPGKDPQPNVTICDGAGKELFCFKEHKGRLFVVRFSPDGRFVESYDDTGAHKVWEAETGRVLLSQNWPTGAENPPIEAIPRPEDVRYRPLARSSTGERRYTDVSYAARPSFSADGKRMTTVSPDGTVKVWDLTEFKELLALKGMTSAWPALGPDGRTLYTAEAGAAGDRELGKRRRWDVASGKEIVAPDVEEGGLSRLPDKERVIGLGHDPSGTLLVGFRLPEGTTVQDVFLSPYRRKEPPLTLWDTRTGTEIATLKNVGTLRPALVAFSPDGTRLAMIVGRYFFQSPGEVVIWDPRTGNELFRLKGHTSAVQGVVFSPDGRRIATVTSDVVKLWDAATGKELLSLTVALRGGPPGGSILGSQGHEFVFNREGTRLFLAPGVNAWDATPLPEKR